MSAFSAYAKKDYGSLLKDVMGMANVARGKGNKAQEITRRTRTSSADVVSCLVFALPSNSGTHRLGRFLGVDARIRRRVRIRMSRVPLRGR